MKLTETEVVASVVGLATFELWKVWNDSAPSISECRKSNRNDLEIRQQLYDADMVVGTLAVIIGTAFAVISKNMTVLILLVVMFGALSFLHHFLMNEQPVTN
jgi:hypothetical protein